MRREVKIKVHHQAPRGYRIFRFGRPWIHNRERDEEEGWKSKYSIFQNKENHFLFVNRKWENEKLKNGELCHTVCSNIARHDDKIKVRTVKAAIRKLLKIRSFFPHNTVFEDFGGYVGAGVKFTIKNKSYSEENVKKEIYKNLKLKPGYEKLSGIEDFDTLVIRLRKEGYFVRVDNEINYWSASILGKNIRGCFCTENEETYSYINNKFAIDNEECFDKWSKCPIVIPIKEAIDNIDNLVLEMKRLSGEEGLEESANWNYKCKYLKNEKV